MPSWKPCCLDLISLNFADKWALHEIEKLMGDYLQRNSQAYQRFEKSRPEREIPACLQRLVAQPDDVLAFECLLDYAQDFPFLNDLLAEMQDGFASGNRTSLSAPTQAKIRTMAQRLLDDIAIKLIVFTCRAKVIPVYYLDEMQPEKPSLNPK